jgi:phosphoesterase RecJ-like protein
MPVVESEWSRAAAVLAGAETVALACHVDPDGDALGSMLALAHFLTSRGVPTIASFGSSGSAHEPLSIPPQYTFLPGLDRLVSAASFPAAPDVLVAFDTASADRLGTLRSAAERAGTVIVIDHHAVGEAFGDIRLCDEDAAATAVLVDQLIGRMGGELDGDIATCLYVGLVTDTGRFSYANTTPEVMALGGRLIGQGIDHAAINRQVWSAHSFGYLKLIGRAMDRATLLPASALVWTAVHQSDLAELGITLQETEGLIDVLHALEAAECALVCKELPAPGGSPPRWKTSLRSKGAVDVGAIAERFGGGGHRFAAGFTATAPLDEIVARVSEVLGAEPERWAS